MISFWIEVDSQDVEAFASTIVLPSYVSHLKLAPFTFASQGVNRDGLSELTLTFEGPGRVEDVTLTPEEYAMKMIRFLCPAVDPAKIRFQEGDAVWHWPSTGGATFSDGDADADETMRIYFSANNEQLNPAPREFPSTDAYASVSRSCVFVGRSIIAQYVDAWLRFIGREDAEASIPAWETETSGGIRFQLPPLGGELLLDSEPIIIDLLRFAGLENALAGLNPPVRAEALARSGADLRPEGVFFSLSAPRE